MTEIQNQEPAGILLPDCVARKASDEDLLSMRLLPGEWKQKVPAFDAGTRVFKCTL